MLLAFLNSALASDDACSKFLRSSRHIRRTSGSPAQRGTCCRSAGARWYLRQAGAGTKALRTESPRFQSCRSGQQRRCRERSAGGQDSPADGREWSATRQALARVADEETPALKRVKTPERAHDGGNLHKSTPWFGTCSIADNYQQYYRLRNAFKIKRLITILIYTIAL